jgi:hypothetical protein
MTAEGFKYKEFAEDLSSQAKAVVPQDLSDADKNYVYNTVKNFCFIAGENLVKDNEHNYTVDQASIITQFIGEWSFHKSLDIIHGKIPNQYRDGIMQKIAFTIFEIAKQATFKGLPQDQMIGLVEHHVKKAYTEAINELLKRGILNQKQAENAANQSNIDDMAKADSEALDNASDLKILKLAAFALIAKKLPNDKITVMLNKMPPSEANMILQYMQVENLESQIDPQLLQRCIQDFQSFIPTTPETDFNKKIRQFGRNVKSVPKSAIESIIQNERELVATFVNAPQKYTTMKISQPILNIICEYTERKINDYKKKPNK